MALAGMTKRWWSLFFPLQTFTKTNIVKNQWQHKNWEVKKKLDLQVFNGPISDVTFIIVVSNFTHAVCHLLRISVCWKLGNANANKRFCFLSIFLLSLFIHNAAFRNVLCRQFLSYMCYSNILYSLFMRGSICIEKKWMLPIENSEILRCKRNSKRSIVLNNHVCLPITISEISLWLGEHLGVHI